MIILAATIVISLTNSGIITKANEAVFATNVKNYSEELNLYLVNKLADNTNYDTKSLNADSTTTPSITDVITSMKEEDKTKFKIVAGTLFYIGDNEDELSSCEQAGVKTKYSELTEAEYNEMYKEEIAVTLQYGEVDEDGVFKGKIISNSTATVPASVNTIALPYGTKSGYFQDYNLTETKITNIILPSTYNTEHLNLHYYRNVTNLRIPSNTTEINAPYVGAGYSAISIKTIKVDPNNTVFDSRDNCNAVIETATNTLIAGCNNTVIPQSVTKIGETALTKCTFNTLVIPESVKSIGDEAFISSTITNLVIQGNSVSIGTDAFLGSIKNIYIEGSVNWLPLRGCSYTIYVRNEDTANNIKSMIEETSQMEGTNATVSDNYDWVAPTN